MPATEGFARAQTFRSAPRLRKKICVGLPMILLMVAVACIRFEFFANPSAPPAAEWRGELFEQNEPLQNVPTIFGVTSDEALTFVARNTGKTTLTYVAAGSSEIQRFHEFEELGKWRSGSWDWCGMGKETFELAPGEEVGLSSCFDSRRRERILGCFTEKETNRSGLVVLASEGPQLSTDFDNLIALMCAGSGAFYIWLMVRVINRRERWAIRTLAIAIWAVVLSIAIFRNKIAGTINLRATSLPFWRDSE